jgi:hypothetical protein
MENWIIQHLGAFVSTTTVLAAAAGWISRHLGFLSGAVEKEVASIDADVLGRVHSPVVKAFLVKVEQAADEAIPGAGDAKYEALTALIVHDLPPSAAVFEGPILAVLTAIGTGAKSGVSQAIAMPVQALPAAPDQPASA